MPSRVNALVGYNSGCYIQWLNRFGLWPYVIYRVGLAAVIYFVLMR